MASLDVTRNYTNGDALLEADLDAIQTDIKTFINTTKVNDDNFQTNGIDAGLKLVAASIDAAAVASLAVTAAKIADSAVTTAKILDANITGALIADGAVTAAELASSAVDTAQFATNAITVAKRAAVGNLASSAIDYTTTSTSEVDVTNATVTITTTGKSVMLFLQHSSTADHAGGQASSASAGTIRFRIYRDATHIGSIFTGLVHNTTGGSKLYEFPPQGITMIDQAPSAASHTYKITAQYSTSVSEAAGIRGCTLKAYEII